MTAVRPSALNKGDSGDTSQISVDVNMKGKTILILERFQGKYCDVLEVEKAVCKNRPALVWMTAFAF